MKIQIKNGNWAKVLKTGHRPLGTDGEIKEMTEEELDVFVEANKSKLTYKDKRRLEYGSAEEQLDYIVENGLEAFITKQKEIKDKYPKE